jgi:thiamine phosphate synthase YjbQ (UPF0047 family)
VVFQREITLPTGGHRDIHDLTDQVQQIVDRSGVQAGLAHVKFGALQARSVLCGDRGSGGRDAATFFGDNPCTGALGV